MHTARAAAYFKKSEDRNPEHKCVDKGGRSVWNSRVLDDFLPVCLTRFENSLTCVWLTASNPDLSGASNESIVQNHLAIASLKVF